MSKDTRTTFSFGDLILPDIDLYLVLSPILIYYILHPPLSLLAKFGCLAAFSPVSVADKAKIDEFYLRTDLDLTCDLCETISKILSKVGEGGESCQVRRVGIPPFMKKCVGWTTINYSNFPRTQARTALCVINGISF